MWRNIVNHLVFFIADSAISTVCCIQVVCNAQEKGTVTLFSRSFAVLSLRLSIKTVSVLISRFISLVKLPLKQQPWECAQFSAELEESGSRLKGSFGLTAVQSEERWDSHGLLGRFLSLKLCLVVAQKGAGRGWSPRAVYLLTKFFDESFYNKSRIWQRRVCRLARRLLSLLMLDAGSRRIIFSGATGKINPGTQVWYKNVCKTQFESSGFDLNVHLWFNNSSTVT